MFREEKLPVVAQGTPEVRREITVTDLFGLPVKRIQIAGCRYLPAECLQELSGGAPIVDCNHEGGPIFEKGSGSNPFSVEGAIEILSRYGCTLDSKWTDSIGRHARMVTTTPRCE